MRSQWFVIHTLSGQEAKVKESIEKRIKPEEMGAYIREVLVPMERVVEVRNQKKTVSTRKLWPGYVFVDMVLLDDDNRIIEKPWYFIKETQGVIGFVGGEPPTPTPTEEVESIKNQISARQTPSNCSSGLRIIGSRARPAARWRSPRTASRRRVSTAPASMSRC